jgi:uncharacterized surface protein with fasciclin (FAS1) repeats
MFFMNMQVLAQPHVMAVFSVGVLVLSTIAACTPPQTTQTPAEKPVASPPSPRLNESPAATNSPTTSDRSIAEVAASTASLSTLTTVVKTAGMTKTLQEKGPYTVFAPSNEAFAAFPSETRQKLLQPENREKLQQVLSYHIVPREIPANQLKGGDVNTVAGKPLAVQINTGTQQVSVNDASVVQPNIQANNGIIHIIDRVVLPPDFVL